MPPEKPSLDGLRIDRAREPRAAVPAWVWYGLVLLVLAGGICGWFVTRPKARLVRTATAREAATSSAQRTLLNASGYVVARREATVSSKATGKVVEVLIEEGMRVTEGQVLARIDASNVEASLRLAEAQLESVRAALTETRVRLDEARTSLRRVAGLARDRIASESELDRAQAEVKTFEARLALQEREISVAERQVAVWRQQQDDSIIRAPFAGVVTSKNAQPGEMISPMSAGGGFTRTGICTIVDMESLEIEIDVNESYINRVEAGQAVEATLDAYSDWKIPCKVIAIVPTADRQKATVRVRVGFEKLDPRVLPQMGVRVAFQAMVESQRPAQQGVVVPKSAVGKVDGRDVVFVVSGGHVERRAITLGGVRGEEAVIEGGLAAGEKIVLEGLETLRDRESVSEQKP